MRYSDICKKYTTIVGSYIGEGYIFQKDGYYLGSDCEMHQELKHPTKGKIKVAIKRRYASGYGDCLVLVVESNGKEIGRERFLPVKRNLLTEDNWFMTESEAEERLDKKRARHEARKLNRKQMETTEARKLIALRYIKRKERGCSRKTVDDIVSVRKFNDYGGMCYGITFKRGTSLDYAYIYG